MKNLTRFLSAVFLFVMLAASNCYSAEIFIDGTAVETDVSPYISNGRTLVPLRVISEDLGAEVTYDAKDRSVFITREQTDIRLVIGEDHAVINGEEKPIDCSSEIKEARTMVPLRFIAESFGCTVDYDGETKNIYISTAGHIAETTLYNLPEYSGKPYVELYGNIPFFDEITDVSFEQYSDFDPLGRAQTAYACIGSDLMPTEPRGSIGQVRPSGWHTVKYDFVDGKYLYNRCHLIGYQLTGENANEKNLITGTRYMNTEGMLPFENMTAEYIKANNAHVMYRVTPVYKGDDMLAYGVRMEAYSVEDNGEGICFDVFVYNVQPGVDIDYTTGDSRLSETVQAADTPDIPDNNENYYVLNTNTKKFHLPSCESVGDIKDKNKDYSDKDREELIADGYSPCKRCLP